MQILTLWGVLFAVASITLEVAAQYLITPFWIVNTLAAIYSLRFRHDLNPYFCAVILTFTPVFFASVWVDDYQSTKTQVLLSALSSFQAVIFIFVYYQTIKKTRVLRYRRTLLLVLPTSISAFTAGLLFMFIPSEGIKFFMFLDYFLEQMATGLALVCVFYGLGEYRQVEWSDLFITAGTLITQHYVSTHPIFYNCFILPIAMVYFTIRYHFKRFVFLMGVICFISFFLMAFSMAGQYWNESQIQTVSYLSAYRISILSFIVVFLILNELQMHHRALSRYLERVSYYDELTGLKNRRYFHKKVLNHIDARLYQGAVLLIDVDNFKKLNDEYGHPVGDLVLQQVSKLLSNTLKGYSHHLFRWGGEEFMILVQDLDLNALIKMSETLIQNGKTSFHINHTDITCSFSMGVAKFNELDTDNYHHLIDRADRMLDVAKANGKQCYVIT